MKRLKSLAKAKIKKGTSVLLRINADAPLTKSGNISDDARLKDAVATINYLLKKQARIIILNKIGRPNGMRVKKLSNKIIANRLQSLLKQKVSFCDGLVDKKARQAVNDLKNGQVLVLENTRFWPGEEKNSLSFAKKIASYGQVYVNEAFSVCHRAEATISLLPKLLPAFAGFSLIKEVDELNKVFISSKKPKIAIIGGAKIDTKVELIKNLCKKVNFVLLGGSVANVVLVASGINMGMVKPTEDEIQAAKKILSKKIILPIDVVVADSINSASKNVTINKVKHNQCVFDIGQQTIKKYQKIIKSAKMIVWNGPVGLFEKKSFGNGTMKVAQAVASTSGYSICGGGETLLALKQARVIKKINFVSTAGGAMLAFLAGESMPGLKDLFEK
jgi:phosphoglycerate kinase